MDGAPLVRELERKAAHRRGDPDKGKERYRADKTDAGISVSRKLPNVHGREVPLIIEGGLE